MNVRTIYNPIVMAANSSVRLNQTMIGAFFATANGTITITDGGGQTLLSAFPVTAGQRLEFEMSLISKGQAPSVVTLAGGAAGLLLV